MEAKDSPKQFMRVGVLSYNRESDHHRQHLAAPPKSQPPPQYLKCGYCGAMARPSLDVIWVENIEACCEQQKQLYKTLAEQRCLLGERIGQGSLKPEEDKMDDSRGLGELPEVKMPVAMPVETAAASKIFRLSRSTDKGWTVVYASRTTYTDFKIKEKVERLLVPLGNHKFGICHPPDGGGLQQKYYSNEVRFLTLFPDGSAQVFYPSGRLALIIVVTKENGRVCIVYDDCQAPSQLFRAMFLSDGRATSYYSNGNIWLKLDTLGGQCYDEVGARMRQWVWTSPTPLLPVFLSLNKMVGVRVLGKEQVFVSFLARGQQAKFSVSSCCAQCKRISDAPTAGPPMLKEDLFVRAAAASSAVLKEDLFVRAARNKINRTFQQLNEMPTMPSHPRKITPGRSYCDSARKIQKDSASVTMNECEQTFIRWCIRDCL